LAIDGEQFAEAESLILGGKAFQAAEAYVLGLFHMYFTVYFHKATRSAEKMLSAILSRVGELIDAGETVRSGLPENHPIVRFIQSRSLEDYLALDDFVIWSSLQFIVHAEDEICRELSARLLHRKLYKAIDVGDHFAGREDAVARFRMNFNKAKSKGQIGK